MTALDAAIQAYWTANASTLAPITGGVYGDLQPPGATMPYAVMYQPANQQKLLRTFLQSGTRTAAEPCTIKFSVFAAGRAVASQSGELVSSVFDDAALSVTGKVAVQCVRQRPMYLITDDTTSQNELSIQVWQAILYYDILVAST